MSDRGPDVTEALTRIEALEAELTQAQRELAVLAKAPSTGCSSPAHAAAPARIAELEAALAKLQGGTTGGLTGLVDRLGKNREKRLRSELARLTEAVAEARKHARGDPALLATLKALRLERDSLR